MFTLLITHDVPNTREIRSCRPHTPPFLCEELCTTPTLAFWQSCPSFLATLSVATVQMLGESEADQTMWECGKQEGQIPNPF